MQEILRQLASIPGVVGSLVYGTRGEILASEFPPIFEPSALQRAAKVLAEDQMILAKMKGTGGALELRYSGGHATVRPAGAGTLLVVCTSPMNPQLLRLSVSQASRRLETLRAPTPQPRTLGSAPRSALPPELTDARERLLHAVVRQIGPIGEFVFEQAWADWTTSSPPSVPGLAKLASSLAREIEESEARAQFVDEARDILSS